MLQINVNMDDIFIPVNTRQGDWKNTVEDLASSIKAHGLLQPVLVAPLTDDVVSTKPYILVYGQRRFYACRKIGWREMPALICDATMSDEDRYVSMLVENNDRLDLSPIEEALAYQHGISQFGMSSKQIADRIGKTGGHVIQRLHLLQLDNDVQDAIANGKTTFSHGRELCRVKDTETQKQLLQEHGHLPLGDFIEKVKPYVDKKKKEPKEDAGDYVSDSTIDTDGVDSVGSVGNKDSRASYTKPGTKKAVPQKERTANERLVATMTALPNEEAVAMMSVVNTHMKKALEEGNPARVAYFKGVMLGIGISYRLPGAVLPTV